MFESDAMVLLPDDMCNADAKVLKLKHPKNGETIVAYYNPATKALNELFCMKEKYVSWFVNDSVIGNTPLSIGTPLDPLFMILPYLAQNPTKFCPLDQILVDEKYPSVMYLDDTVSEEQLSCVADVKPSSDKIIKFNKAKTLDWLSSKITTVISEMKRSDVSPGFNSTLSYEEYTRYACGIVCDYITPTMSSDLHERLGIEVISYEEEKPAKRPKLNNAPKVSDSVKTTASKGKAKPAPVKLTKGQKQLASINTKGMKSMSSFFSKK